MNITLEYSQPGGRTRRVWLGKDQVLRFGRSSHADVVIDTDSKMADVHFEVTGLGHEWRITSVGSENAVFVNGRPANFHPLAHGDSVHAGGTVFQVSIEGLSPVDMVNEEAPVVLTAPEPRLVDFWTKNLPSKVDEFNVAAKDSQLTTVFNALAHSEQYAGSNLFCALNAKRLGRPLRSLASSGSDLFSHAPEEIRETDSLAMLPVPTPIEGAMLSEIALAGRANASFMVLSPQPLDEFLDSHKLVWGWYGRPNILHHQLSLGSSHLGEKLVVGCEVILLFGSTQDSGLKLLVQKTHSDQLVSALQTVLI